MEHAGYIPGQGEDIVGVYASAAFNTYLQNVIHDFDLANPIRSMSVLLGNDKDFIASRVNYKLNLKGPAIISQTACSSSLVGICMACQSLMEYQIDMAIAGGVSIDVPNKHGFMHQETDGAISRDCLCRAFDAAASGIGAGNGIGVLVLKRIQDAIDDGDTIHAVIRGFATNNDGSDKIGFTAPSVTGQQKVIAEAVAMADVPPASIGYVETHGTGTIMGDPIEIQALNNGYGGSELPTGTCAIGSVKTNIGHLNTAAGVASVIKTACSLRDGKLTPSLHFTTPNPAIDFKNSPFYVNTELKDWKRNDTPLRAGVSSFGLGGNNAHIIMEEPPAQQATTEKMEWYLLPLSARTETALAAASDRLAEHLAATPEADIAHVAYTLQNGRTAFPNRKVVFCTDKEDAKDVLDTGNAKRTILSRQPVKDTEKQVVFMFSGAGTQFAGMGTELYEKEPVFRETVDRCSEILSPILKADLQTILYPGPEATEEALATLSQPIWAMTGIFVTEYAMTKLLESRGVTPQAMIGHSLGEYVAATVAGVFSLEDALHLVAHRGRLMAEVPEGGMLVALATEEVLREHLGNTLSIGAINGPALCMVSGPVDDMAVLEKRLKTNKIGFRRLPGGRAGHGSMLEPILDKYHQQLSQVKLSAPQIPYISNVTGDWIKAEEATDPQYWVRHLRNPVRFSEGMETILESTDRILMEIGPGQGLKTLAARHPAHTDAHHVIPTMRDARQKDPDTLVFHKAIGSLWVAGLDLDWPRATGFTGKGRRIPLPTYPFERQSYFVDSRVDKVKQAIEQANIKRPDVGDWFYVPSWKRSMSHAAWRGDVDLSKEQTWLIFMDPYGLGSMLKTILDKAGQTVITVHTGIEYTGKNDTFTLNPGRQDDYDALFRYLAAKDRVPEKIIHLWNVTPGDRMEVGIDYYETLQDQGYNSLIRLMRGVSASNLSTYEIDIDVITTNLFSVIGHERLCPEKSPLLGPCRVIPNEFPSFHCKAIDIELPDDADLLFVATTLLGEILCEHPDFRNEKTVAYRNHHRWIQDFESIPLDAEAGEAPPLRENGVYLVTGGLGGVGYVLAEHLAKTYRPKLALIGRTPLPDRKEWDRWIADHGTEDRISAAITKARRLEELGAQIMLLSVDVSDRVQMKDAANRIAEGFGKINGIIHAAGVEGGGMIELRDLADTDSNAHAKIRGTLVMEEIYQDTKLDFFMLCSSLVSFIGAVGGVDYASANIFLDTFANERRRSSQLNTIAVNWDYWANIGMGRAIFERHYAVFSDNLDKLAGEGMSEAIAPHEGVDAFDRLLSTNFPQLLVSTRDLPSLLKNLQQTTGAMREVFDHADLGEAGHPRPKLSTPLVAPRNETEQIILAVWENILGIEGLGVHDSYFDLGGDSLHAMPLVARLKDTFQIEFPLRIIYSHGTVAEMAEFVNETRQSGPQGADS